MKGNMESFNARRLLNFTRVDQQAAEVFFQVEVFNAITILDSVIICNDDKLNSLGSYIHSIFC